MTQRKTIFIYSEDLEAISYPEHCPFSSQRTGITRNILLSMGLLSGSNREELPPISATDDELEKFHSQKYLSAIKRAEQGELSENSFLMGLGTPDCPVFSGMFKHAALATGATLTAARLLADQQAHIVFSPSGGFHHAGPELASGFCYLNDIVLGCLELSRAGKKVAFLDVDAHHCDGVQNAFYQQNDIITISLHENPETLFPGTGFADEIGRGDGLGFSVNVPLPAGVYDQAYLHAFREVALPLLHATNPDVIVLELGMDALAGDPLTHLNLTNNAYAEVIELVMSFGKPILATGGGGYHVDNTTRGWALAWSILCGESSHDDLTLGLGGVMLESTEWHGGLRDRTLVPNDTTKKEVDQQISRTLKRVKQLVFPIHGI